MDVDPIAAVVATVEGKLACFCDTVDDVAYSEAAVAQFPLMQLSNEVLAGVTQRCKEGTRRQFECVDERAAAVTRVHGAVYRNDLVVLLTDGTSKDHLGGGYRPCVKVDGLPMDPGSAPAAVRSLLSRHRRITRLTLYVDDDVRQGFWEKLTSPAFVVPILDSLLCCDHLQLTTIKIDARVGRCLDDVVTRVSRLLQRHVATIVDVTLWPCDDDAAPHAHVELYKAVAACVGVRRFSLRVGDRCCLQNKNVLPAYVSSFMQLRVLELDCTPCMVGAFDVADLPKPSQLEVLNLTCRWPRLRDGLLVAAQTRGDVFASLRALTINHYWYWQVVPDNFLDRLLEFSPQLKKLRVGSTLGGDAPPYARSFVGQFFAAVGRRQMRFELGFRYDDYEEEEAPFEVVCAKLLAGIHAAAPDAAIACSDAQVFVLGSGIILKAAIDGDAANSAVLGRAFVDFVQSSAAAVAAVGPLLANAAVARVNGGGDALDFAAVVPYYAAMMEAMGARVELATELANKQDEDEAEVVFRLTRGHGADKRQLDLIVSKLKFYL